MKCLATVGKAVLSRPPLQARSSAELSSAARPAEQARVLHLARKRYGLVRRASPGTCSPQDLFPSQARHALPTQCWRSDPIPELDVGPLDWRSGRLCPHHRGEPDRPAGALAGARSADLLPPPKAGLSPQKAFTAHPAASAVGRIPQPARRQGSDSLDPGSWELPAHRGPAHQGPNSLEFGHSRGRRAVGEACVALMWTVLTGE